MNFTLHLHLLRYMHLAQSSPYQCRSFMNYTPSKRQLGPNVDLIQQHWILFYQLKKKKKKALKSNLGSIKEIYKLLTENASTIVLLPFFLSVWTTYCRLLIKMSYRMKYYFSSHFQIYVAQRKQMSFKNLSSSFL